LFYIYVVIKGNVLNKAPIAQGLLYIYVIIRGKFLSNFLRGLKKGRNTLAVFDPTSTYEKQPFWEGYHTIDKHDANGNGRVTLA